MRKAAISAAVLGSEAAPGGRMVLDGHKPACFPNPQTKVQADPHVSVHACEATSRTVTDATKRRQLRPKLRPQAQRVRGTTAPICVPPAVTGRVGALPYLPRFHGRETRDRAGGDETPC